MTISRRTFLGFLGTTMAAAALPPERLALGYVHPTSEVTTFDRYFVEAVTWREDRRVTQYYLGFSTKDGGDWGVAMIFDVWNEKTQRQARQVAERAVRRLMTKHFYTWGDIVEIK